MGKGTDTSKPENERYERCATQHFGLWAVETCWFAAAVHAVKVGAWRPSATSQTTDSDAADLYHVTRGGLAHIYLYGQMVKGVSSFGGASSVQVRMALRTAATDDAVKAIMLHIDSPGGTVAGTASLADAVRKVNAIKPVTAQVEDMCASAAYWVASQASEIVADPGSQVGSIGTMAVVEDSSKAADRQGIKVHLVSTGAYKGAFSPGLPVTDDQLAYLRGLVEDANEHFLEAVSRGRMLAQSSLREVATGAVWDAAKAVGLGLIDAVQFSDKTAAGIEAALRVASLENGRRRRARQASLNEAKQRWHRLGLN